MKLGNLIRPDVLSDRIASGLKQRRRLRKLRGTVADGLSVLHIDSLELLEAVRPLDIRVVYDIGANIGTWVLLAKTVFPDALVEAFEPLSQHVEPFQKNVRAVSGVRLHNAALGSRNDAGLMHVTAVSDSSSLLRPTHVSRLEFGTEEAGTVPIIVRRLDDYCAEHRLPSPDLIKLDVQGYELEVLKGAAECLRAATALVAEVSFADYYEDQCQFHELVEFTARHGFFLSTLGVRTPVGAALRQTDVLFLKRHAGVPSNTDGRR